jgi:hypothetical protein
MLPPWLRAAALFVICFVALLLAIASGFWFFFLIPHPDLSFVEIALMLLAAALVMGAPHRW